MTGLLALLVGLTLGATTAYAQTTAVCSNTPTASQRVECTEDSTSTDAIDIEAEGVDIDTTAASEPGITASHAGNAKIDISVRAKADDQGRVTQSTIDTTGAGSHGIQATHTGTGNVSIDTEVGKIATTGNGSHGINVGHTGATGNVVINGATTIETSGESAHGINVSTNATGRLDVDFGVRNITTTGGTTPDINTATRMSHGVNLKHGGVGAIDLDVSSGTKIRTTGRGVSAEHSGTGDVTIKFEEGVDIETSLQHRAAGIYGYHKGTGGTGDVTLKVTGIAGENTITTSGISRSHAIEGINKGLGDVDITVKNVIMTTTGFSTTISSTSAAGVEGFMSPENATAPPSDPVTGHLSTFAGVYNVNINVNESRISTMGQAAHGISGRIAGVNFPISALVNGNINITATDTNITTTGKYAAGIRGKRDKTHGDIVLNMTGGSIITEGDEGIAVDLRGTTGQSGDFIVNVTDAELTTKGNSSYGIFGWNTGGAVDIDVRNVDITTEGTGSSNFGIYGVNTRIGDIDIDARGGFIKTAGVSSYGIYGYHAGNGDVTINTHDGHAITTEGTGGSFTLSHGIYGRCGTGICDVDIDARSGSITTAGLYSYGIRGDHSGTRDIMIDTHGGHAITTTGEGGHGIVAYHFGTGNTRSMAITAGGTINASGASAQGVRVGTLTSGAPVRVAAIGDDGYRKQTVTVNGAVTSAAEGVYLAGGGRVVIGSLGSITSGSGVAILATGDTPGADPVNDPSIKPKLHVSMHLDGRRVAQAIGDDWIINDGGETTILVNDVKLHDGAAGVVTSAVAANGGWDVSMVSPGVRVTDRMDPNPVNWTTAASTTPADRDFSGADFTETVALTCPQGQVGTPPNCMPPPSSGCPDGQVGTPPNCMPPPSSGCPDGQVGTPPNCMPPPPSGCPDGQVGTPPNCMPPPPSGCPDGQVGTPPNCMPPPPPSCPPGQVGIPPNCTEPEPEQPMFMEEYAPRAAVYEVLPDFLLRLTGQGPSRTCGSAPDEPVWVRFAGGQGSYEADRSTTGATYDLERFETEGGLSASFTDQVRGWVSVRHVWGSAGATSPTGGGEIDVRGLGTSVGGAWQSPTGAYARGCFSYMAYNVDFASNQRGLLKAGTDGRAYTLDVEAGRRYALTGEVHLTPRVWVVGSRVSVDSFTDAVDARVSFADANRIIGGLGFVADTTRPWGEGEFVLRGSVDVERLLSGTETRVQVSGERLSAEATEHGLRFGLNGIYRQGRFSIGAEVAARQELGSDDSEYASFLNVGMRF